MDEDSMLCKNLPIALFHWLLWHSGNMCTAWYQLRVTFLGKTNLLTLLFMFAISDLTILSAARKRQTDESIQNIHRKYKRLNAKNI